MVRSLVAKNISLYDLAQEFKLRSTPEPLTIDRLPALTDPEQQVIDWGLGIRGWGLGNPTIAITHHPLPRADHLRSLVHPFAVQKLVQTLEFKS
jgi:hypothetical protein